MRKIEIGVQQYADLKANGHCVPRSPTTGEILDLRLSATYNFYAKGEEIIKAKVTQIGTTHIKKID